MEGLDEWMFKKRWVRKEFGVGDGGEVTHLKYRVPR
jgi:hypothetical protein